MRALLARLGDPERRFAAVHIAGTNGKGSTAAMIEGGAARAAGGRTGLYTSPHLLRLTERIRVDGVELERRRAAELGARVLAAGGELTFFEVVTAMALLAFAARAVDVAVHRGRARRPARRDQRHRAVRCVSGRHRHRARSRRGPRRRRWRRSRAKRRASSSAARRRSSRCDDDAARASAAGDGGKRGRAGAALRARLRRRDLPSLALLGAHQRRNAALARQTLSLLPPALRPSPRELADGLARVGGRVVSSGWRPTCSSMPRTTPKARARWRPAAVAGSDRR